MVTYTTSYRNWFCCLLTSSHEGLSMVLLEAIRLKLLITSHAVGCIPSLPDKGKCAMLVDGLNFSAYASVFHALFGTSSKILIHGRKSIRQS